MLKTKRINKIKKPSKSLRDKFLSIFYILLFFFIIFYCFRLKIYNSILNSNSKITEASIINEKNILGKGVITQTFTYSYEFNIEGNSYRGDSKNEDYKIGNKIEVEYWPNWPFINRPVKKSGNVSD